MGAAAILRAVHQGEAQVDGIVLEAVFDRMLTAVRNRFKSLGVPSFPSAELLVFWGGWQAGFDGFRHNPAEYAASVGCPVLMLHVDSDPRATLGQAQAVLDAIPGAKKEFVVFPGNGHEPCLKGDPDRWHEAVARWLDARTR